MLHVWVVPSIYKDSFALACMKPVLCLGCHAIWVSTLLPGVSIGKSPPEIIELGSPHCPLNESALQTAKRLKRDHLSYKNTLCDSSDLVNVSEFVPNLTNKLI